MRKLDIKKPIIFFDLETTGTNPDKDRIVEIGLVKLHISGEREVFNTKINPGIKIPKGASDVHGITNEDVEDSPTFASIAQTLYDVFEGCDIGGFNSNVFDIPLLFNEFHRAGLFFGYFDRAFIDVCNIYKREEPRTLGAAYKFYLGKDLENAHSAEADILATIDILEAQLQRYEHLPENVTELARYSNYDKEPVDLNNKFYRDGENEIRFNFGTHRGIKCKLKKDYLRWMIDGDFSPDVKYIAKKILVDGLF